jgi:hypothetical protein
MERPKAQSTDPETIDMTDVQFPDVNTVEGRDEILRRAVEEERRYLRLTPARLAMLKAAASEERRYFNGEDI